MFQRPSTRLDTVAAIFSNLCLLHCLAVPAVLLALGVGGAVAHGPAQGPAHGPDWMHWALIGAAIPVSLFALARSTLRHRLPQPLIIACMGFLVTGCGAADHGSSLEGLLTVTGGLVIGFSHYLNWRALNRRTAGCSANGRPGSCRSFQASSSTSQ